MSWIWPTFINRDLPLSSIERRAIHRDAWKLWWSNKRNVALYLALPAAYLLAVPFASDVGGRLAAQLGASGVLLRLIRAGAPLSLFLACFVLGGMVLQRIRFAPCVYRATRQHGHDVCPRCGYWLRGLPEDITRCPECGAHRACLAREGSGPASATESDSP